MAQKKVILYLSMEAALEEYLKGKLKGDRWQSMFFFVTPLSYARETFKRYGGTLKNWRFILHMIISLALNRFAWVDQDRDSHRKLKIMLRMNGYNGFHFTDDDPWNYVELKIAIEASNPNILVLFNSR